MAGRSINVPSAIQRKLKNARVARLATIHPKHGPHLVPVCFVYDGAVFYTALDKKPKRIAAMKLTRVRNIESSPEVALLIDEYREDWNRLWYVLVRGDAEILPDSSREERIHALQLLRRKYRQYTKVLLRDAAPIIRITPRRIVSWAASRNS